MMKRRIAAMGLALLMMAVTVGCSGKILDRAQRV